MATKPDEVWKSKQSRWYLQDLSDHIAAPSRRLLEAYSHIPADDVESHIYKMRDILWSEAPYPCIGKAQFLAMQLSKHPRYNYVLSLLSTSTSSPGPFLLDLGCCVAQELRSLAYAGIPSSNLYGSDIVSAFLDTSYEVFRDKDTFKGTLVQADIFSSTLFEKEFLGLEEKFRVIHAALFLHLFDWEQQILVCERIIKLLSKQKGSIFLGEMVGYKNGEARPVGIKGKERNVFLHDETSFRRMWNETVERGGGVSSEWEVEAKFTSRKDIKTDTSGWFFVGEGVGWLTFSVERT